ncbi:MAG: translation initiation factor IF-2 [Candidatus Nanoarchaeia archaeon]|jgi:translation initiation factor IF-2|nr:translation initiation factor IF-2 [Candidatus Nanoarchaeia archaeon]
MSTISIQKLASALKVSDEKLIIQLKEAGIEVSNNKDVVTSEQKLLLLNHLRGSHSTKSTVTSAPRKLTVNRRSQSELKLAGGFGKTRTVNVEVRKKRTYLKKEALIEKARKEKERTDEEKKQLAVKEVQKQNEIKEITAINDEKEHKKKIDLESKSKTEVLDKKRHKKQKRKKQIYKDPFSIEELHVSGKVKKRKKRKIRRTLSSSIIDQTNTFEKPTTPVKREITIPESITPKELAQKLAIKVNEIIPVMMKLGVMATANDNLDQETAILLVDEMGHKAMPLDERTIEDILQDSDETIFDKVQRPPVIAIMGHVDHGKTSLLDCIRKSKIIDKEAGGITQHIGAYTIDHNSTSITFLDTPGHAAFSQMRSRGANVTDIIILVVAADDGVKPQTVEAIDHAKISDTPIIVAINKIDKPEADIEKVKNELVSNEIIPEDLGGDHLFVNISAESGEGIDHLIETITLQSEILDLKAVNQGKAIGTVIEAGIEGGKGVASTILITKGKLKKGDLIIVGEEFGKARLLLNEDNSELDTVTPSLPVKVFGLSSAPNAGDELRVVDTERQGREISSLRKQRRRTIKASNKNADKMQDFIKKSMDSSKQKKLALVIKTDVQGSAEAIKDSLIKLTTEDVGIDIISTGVGGINESDINLAEVSKAFIIGFNVRADTGARKIVKDSSVEIKYYSVIYEIIDDISEIVKGHASPVIKEEIVGLAEVREVFDSPDLGKIAGCLVIEGTVVKSNSIRVLRDNTVIYEGELESLRRFKDSVNEVKSGTECGIGVKNYNDIKNGDQIECFTDIEVKK